MNKLVLLLSILCMVLLLSCSSLTLENVDYGWPVESVTTVSPANGRSFWNVRAMPRRTISGTGMLVIDWPSKAISPWVGRKTPLIILNNVVLPASALAHQLFNALLAAGRGDLDHSAVITVIEDLSHCQARTGNAEPAKPQ